MLWDMAIKRISQVGEKVIRAKAKQVNAKNKANLKKVLKDLADTLRAENLVGIAAPQIGVGLQIFLSEVRKTKWRKATDTDGLRTYINPQIISRSKKQTELQEGCGSLGSHAWKLFGPVKRPAEVEVEALDENLKPFRLKAKGLLAKIIQHEYDHLQGTVIIDKFTDTRRCWVREKK
jgi:peptide deformylase